MRIISLTISAAAMFALCSCNSGKIDQLARQNDSLRNELQKSKAVIASFQKVTTAMDSMKAFKKLNVPANNAPAHEVLAKKVSGIGEHFVKTEKDMHSLNKALRASRHENTAYVMMVDALKGELQIRVDEVTALEKNISDVEAQTLAAEVENIKTVNGLISTITEKQQMLSSLQGRLDKLQIDFKNTEAEAVYARAKAVEESARKTRFAPNKKREALAEALELYKKAKSLGKVEAEGNIQALEKFEVAKLPVQHQSAVF